MWCLINLIYSVIYFTFRHTKQKKDFPKFVFVVMYESLLRQWQSCLEIVQCYHLKK